MAVDVLEPLPQTSNGNQYILLFTEYLTKLVEAFAVKTNDSQTTAQLIMDEIFSRHGAPRRLISDRGSNFLGGGS